MATAMEMDTAQILNFIEDHYPRYLETRGVEDSPYIRIDYYRVSIDECRNIYKEYPTLIDKIIERLILAINKQRKRIQKDIQNNFRIESSQGVQEL